MSLLQGPLEGTAEHCVLEKEVGYSYHQVLSKIIYAYVVCRVDIGYAATFLSHFAQVPAAKHYKTLKDAIKYLRRTINWGIIYWREHPVDSLLHVPIPNIAVDPSLPMFPMMELLHLVGFLDAAHATDVKTQRSITSYAFTLTGGAVAFKSKLQATVATSSTEAEFIAAIRAAKVDKYLRSVLAELGVVQTKPMPLYVDNQATITMVNECWPMTRSHHIDIQHFAIQEWRAAGDIELHHIPGVINVSNATMKPLGWMLHLRHVQ